MKVTIKIFLLLLLIIGTKSLKAQTGTVIVMNSDTPNEKQSILIKWYNEPIVCDQGVNIYRKSSSDNIRLKITTSPFTHIRPIPKTSYETDPSLKEYVKIFDETPAKEIKSIALLNVLLKSIESDEYAKYIGILFEDQTVIKGETYIYEVMKLENGSETLIGISPEITAGSFEPVNAPQDIEVIAGSQKSFMKWKPELQRYYAVNIFRSSSIEPTEIQLNELPIMLSQKENDDGTLSIPEPYFTDHDLKDSVTYHYCLQALDYFGRRSLFSDTVSVLIKDLIPPLPPYRLRADQDNLKTTLKWLNDTSSDLVGINVYRSTDDSVYQKMNTVLLPKTDTSYIDNVEKSGTYFYYVTATDEEENEARSPKLMVEIPDIIPPEKPTGLSALADTGKIHLSWNVNKDEDLMGYIVYRRIKGKKNKEFAPVFADPLSLNNYSDNINKVAKNYFEYVVRAIDSSFNVSEFSNSVSAQMPDVLPPNKPKFKKTWLIEKGAMLEWVPNLDPDLAGYDIFRKEKSDSLVFKKLNKVLLPPDQFTYFDSETENGKVYFYKLCAYDSTGNKSPLSAPFLGAIKKPEQDDSSNFKKISVNYNKKKNTIKIKWKISEEENFKGCVLYRSEEGSTFKPITALIKENEYIDTDIISNTVYIYQLRIYENTGKLIKSEKKEIKTDPVE